MKEIGNVKNANPNEVSEHFKWTDADGNVTMFRINRARDEPSAI